MQNQSAEKELFNIADTQEGFFTAKQAESCGYSAKNHHYYVATEKWIKEERGIYRLANYPPTRRPDLMLWYLWSKNRNDQPQGVYSHETALAIYDLSDVMPAKLHMTVPKQFRRTGEPPKILRLHKGNLPEEDISDYYGVKMTKPIRTILDVIAEGSLSEEFILQAISEAFERRIIRSEKQLLEHPCFVDNHKVQKKLKEYLNHGHS